MIFILTTNPSELASRIHQIGGLYKIAYAFSLALRYTPDIKRILNDFQSPASRGNELSGKAYFMKRVRGNLTIEIPLIFSSLERIETISSAMELRHFGKRKKDGHGCRQNHYNGMIICTISRCPFCSMRLLMLWADSL